MVPVEAAGVVLAACVAVAGVVVATCPVVLAPAELVSACWDVTALFELRFCHVPRQRLWHRLGVEI